MGVAVINLGLKSLRCIVFDDNGRKLTHSSRAIHSYLRANEVEQDAHEWIRALYEVMADVWRAVPSHVVQAVTVTASASCLVPVDATGEPTHRVQMVSDGRCHAEAADLERALRNFGGIWHDVRITTDMLLPKAEWLRRNRERVFDQTAYFLSPADFLIMYLTGNPITDPHNASKFLAREASPGQFAYPEWLPEKIGIGIDRLPRIAAPGTRIGTIRSRVASDLGFSQGTIVILATYDALCAVVGSGVATPGRAAIVSGTVTSVRALSSLMPPFGTRGIYSSPWIEPSGLWLVGGSNNMGGGLVEWHKQAFYRDRDDDPYALMGIESEQVAPGAEGLVFLPYLLGERAPVWDSEARGLFFGLDRRHTRSHFTRAVFESVAYSARHILEHIHRAGCEIHEVRYSGGLARLPAVGRILAHVLQRPVVIPTEFETTSVGAYLITAKAMGRYNSLQEACDEVIDVETVFSPDSALAPLYDDCFALYKELYNQTRDLQRLRKGLLERFPTLLDSDATVRENL